MIKEAPHIWRRRSARSALVSYPAAGRIAVSFTTCPRGAGQGGLVQDALPSTSGSETLAEREYRG